MIAKDDCLAICLKIINCCQSFNGKSCKSYKAAFSAEHSHCRVLAHNSVQKLKIQ